MRHSLSTMALLVAIVCFSVALFVSTSVVHGGNTAAMKDVGWIAIIVALLLGSRP